MDYIFVSHTQFKESMLDLFIIFRKNIPFLFGYTIFVFICEK